MNRRQGIQRMHMSLKGMVAAIALAFTLTLTACGNVSHGVAKEGSSAGQLVWPAPGDVTPMHKGGTFPDPAAVRAVQAGMNKQQIAQLIGYPHFEEGVWGVREWNYVFNFRDAPAGRNTVCQFKILFDVHKVSRSFYWKPHSCSAFMISPASPTVIQKTRREVTFWTDTLFKFDRSSIDDITDDGKGQLDRLAKSLIADNGRIQSIRVLGYSDRLGGDAYDLSLSRRRAYAVMNYLVEKGIRQDLIIAEGMGKSNAMKDCADMPRDALIACLAPNRRVVVQLNN